MCVPAMSSLPVCVAGFLTGVLQNHARKLGMSVDSLEFMFTVSKKATDTADTLSDLKENLNIKKIAFTVTVCTFKNI